ncbi:MAG: 4Fe-4S binding protein [Clostridiales bacterium]|nr:4Fe-4S binding protein [Clostridiales bacterium]
MSCNQFVELLPGQGEITDKAEDVCPVDWALKIADKARLNNCGKSVMCRDGMNQMYTIILDITTEKGRPEDIELLRDICTVIKESQGCDIAAKAAMLIDESIRLYGEEWDAHTRRKRCTALVCEKYYTVHILPEKCRGAGECIKVCWYGAIAGGEGLVSVIDNDKCRRCGECYNICPSGAIVRAGAVKPRIPEVPVPVGGQPSAEEGDGGMRRRKRKAADSEE